MGGKYKWLFALIVFFIFTEFLVYFFAPMPEGYHQSDAVIGKRLLPDMHKNIGSIIKPHFLITNSLGYHDSEHMVEKPFGFFRIAFLGDSQVEDVEKDIDKLLFKQAEKEFSNAECLSFGVAGQGTAQEFLQLDLDVLKFKPDYIVVVATSNDVEDNSYDISKYNYRPYFKLFGDELKIRHVSKKDMAIDNARRIVLDNYRTLAFMFRMKEIARRYYALQDIASYNPVPRMFWKNQSGEYGRKYDEAWNITERIYIEMNNKARQNGARLIVVAAPAEEAVATKNISGTFNGQDYDYSLFAKKLGVLCKRNNIEFIDLMPGFRDYYSRTGIRLNPEGQNHWNDEGNRLAAEIISEKIKNDIH